MTTADPLTGLEAPVRAMIEATNRGDSAALVAAFAPDAVLVDFGRTFTGREEIARWNDNENIGTNNRLRITGVTRSDAEVRVAITVTGDGYNGSGVLAFAADETSIRRLVITA
jgi:ketosteroid isomerase-like protein